MFITSFCRKRKATNMQAIDTLLSLVSKLDNSDNLTVLKDKSLYVWNLRTYSKTKITSDSGGNALPPGDFFLISVGICALKYGDNCGRSIIELYTDGDIIVHKCINSVVQNALKSNKLYKNIMDAYNSIEVGKPVPTSNMWLKGVLCTLTSMTASDRFRHVIEVLYEE